MERPLASAGAAESHLSSSQKRQVEELLDHAGWRIVLRDLSPDQWWLDELWVLESNWSPQDATAYVSFLVDPQGPGPGERRHGEHVWAVAVTRDRPRERLEAEPVVSLRRRWETRNLPELRKFIDMLRVSDPERTG